MASIIIYNSKDQISAGDVPASVVEFAQNRITGDSGFYSGVEGLWYFEKTGVKQATEELERLRKMGAAIAASCKKEKEESATLHNMGATGEHAAALAEGFLLADYSFNKYVKDSKNNKIQLDIKGAGSEQLSRHLVLQDAVFKARDLVNEPVNKLNAVGLSEVFTQMGAEAGFSVEVWNEAKIESQKMGGLLAVNAGSQEPPTFTIMEYKPANAVNEKPIVFVGKGVVFDTGGLSLKPTPNSMDQMKSDMGGSAAVSGTIYAAAKLKLPLWIIALVPATDNRPGENATCPGDIITMYDGTTVEVLNTDAEGRLILADALAFAKKYNPELVLDFATLTGAAMRALGSYGSAMMGNASEDVKNQIKSAGELVYERIAELPLWEEYFNDTKGEISDLKNLGKAEGGAQSAAMFLRHFTDYPWLHFDIAGTAFLGGADGYRPKGGTGTGIRLMIEFLTRRSNG